jgi:rubrerythrin
VANPLVVLKTRLLLKFFWTPSKLAEILARFQAVEADGVWHLERALERTSGPHRVELFGQIIEEMSHADRFSSLAKSCSTSSIYFPQVEREDLYAATQPVWKTLAFVHVGEEDATSQFDAIVKSLPEGDLRRSFASMLVDESGHVGLTESLALSLGISKGQLKKGVYEVRLRRLKEAWMRMGQGFMSRISFILLSLVYWLVVPAFFLFARAFMTRNHTNLATDQAKRLVR